jgi:L-ornithine Nalpha-acyltransferase
LQHERHAFKRHEMKIRLAQTPEEIRVAQRLRYCVFHEECGAKTISFDGIDQDHFDPVAEHILVIEPFGLNESDFALADGNLVGTYRLITEAAAKSVGGFYSQAEYDLEPLLQRKADLRFLELGRSCILKRARGTAVIELLWQGIWDFVRRNRIDVMLGCASFEGIDPSAHAEALSFLAQNVATPEDWCVKAHESRRHEMNMLPKEAIDTKRAIFNLPPLIKGYLKLGCYFGQGAVVDHEFNTTDVLVVLPISAINPRYFARFGNPA